MAGQGLVDAVVDDFLRQVIGAGGIGVHAGALAHRFEAGQDFDGSGVVGLIHQARACRKRRLDGQRGAAGAGEGCAMLATMISKRKPDAPAADATTGVEAAPTAPISRPRWLSLKPWSSSSNAAS